MMGHGVYSVRRLSVIVLILSVALFVALLAQLFLGESPDRNIVTSKLTMELYESIRSGMHSENVVKLVSPLAGPPKDIFEEVKKEHILSMDSPVESKVVATTLYWTASSGSFFFYDQYIYNTPHSTPDTTGPRTIISGGLCPLCRGKIVIELHWDLTHGKGGEPEFFEGKFVSLLYPRKHSSRPLPQEIPAQYRADYDEACLVLTDSPKSSAALSRRLLQRLFHEHFGIIKRDLFQEIEEYIAVQRPPSDLADQLHAVRSVGNIAAHPLKDFGAGSIVDVQPGEAEWLIELIESVFDQAFVRPQRDAARKASLYNKLTAIGKPTI